MQNPKPRRRYRIREYSLIWWLGIVVATAMFFLSFAGCAALFAGVW